jgi:nitrite reductase (cytochrome c-552)
MTSRAERLFDLVRRIAVVSAAVALLDAAAGAAQAQTATPAKPAVAKAAPAKGAPARSSFNAAPCLDCHKPIKAFHDEGKHKTVGCNACHAKLSEHSADEKVRPTTAVDPAACGTCHKNQFESMYTMNWEKTARKEKSLATGPSPNPAFDKLMGPHGFTREHAEPRSHAFALYDQVVVDRAFGGRFNNKEGWQGLTQPGGNFRIWDKLDDEFPGQDHKAFKPGTAAAANPVCMSCKTQDHILDWAYLGDPHPAAKWSRTSKVVDFVKDVNHSLNCFFCHDPHSGGPRVVRDGLIQALTRPEQDTLWHADKRGAKISVVDLGTRGFTRKVAKLSKSDSKMMCAQCHVEYNCNPGTDLEGKPVSMADGRTNHFPLKKVGDIGKHYTDLKFRDFRHGITGAMLWKAQHPDAEVFYNSPHARRGAECSSCHMPKVKDPKTGKTYTSHWQTSPRHYIKETCLTCHDEWSAKQAVYAIDSLKNRYEGKKRKAEYWLTRMIDKFEEARNIGVDDKTLDAVREKHAEAHINWEYWAAANGAHFHNPDEATSSLNRSMVVSQEGIKLLDDAMAARRKASAMPVAAAAPAPAK